MFASGAAGFALVMVMIVALFCSHAITALIVKDSKRQSILIGTVTGVAVFFVSMIFVSVFLG